MSTKTDLEDEEKDYFDKCVRSFRFYKFHAFKNLQKGIKDYKALPLYQQKMLKNFMVQQAEVRKCIEHNYMFVLHMIDDVDEMFNLDRHDDCHDDCHEACDNENKETTMESDCKLSDGLSQGDLDRVYTTIRQFVRDWSSEGQLERDKCYAPIIKAVSSRYPNPDQIEVLVPGAGLGRLAFDFASKGFNCEGNEFSIFMLIASNFVLNKTASVKFDIYPWSTCSTNNNSHNDRVAMVQIPDIDTTNIPESVEFGISAGDFTEVYADECDRFHIVAASFFLDTAHNIIDYLELIYKILKPGGHLVSLGPLLYHYASMPDQPSLELPWEDLILIIEELGFVIEDMHDVQDVPYIANHNSMLGVHYTCKFIVARKPCA